MVGYADDLTAVEHDSLEEKVRTTIEARGKTIGSGDGKDRGSFDYRKGKGGTI